MKKSNSIQGTSAQVGNPQVSGTNQENHNLAANNLPAINSNRELAVVSGNPVVRRTTPVDNPQLFEQLADYDKLESLALKLVAQEWPKGKQVTFGLSPEIYIEFIQN